MKIIFLPFRRLAFAIVLILSVSSFTWAQPTASIRPSSTFCGGFAFEIYNLSGTYPLSVTLSDQHAQNYIVSISQAEVSGNVYNLFLPPSNSYTLKSITDAASNTALLSGSATTSPPGIMATAAVSASNTCRQDLTINNPVTFDARYLWYVLKTDNTYSYFGGATPSPVTSVNQSGKYVSFAIPANFIINCIQATDFVNVSITATAPSTPTLSTAGTINLSCSPTSFVDILANEIHSNYRWYNSGVLIPGQTLSSLHATVAGNYSVEVSEDGSCYSLYSKVISANVIKPSAPVKPILSDRNTLQIACGSTRTISVSNSTNYTYYKWYKDGLEIPAQTSSSLNINLPGTYTVAGAVDTACYSVLSDAVIIQTIIATSVAISSSNGNYLSCGQSTNLTATAVNGFTYNWYKDNVLISGQTSNTLTGINATGSYSVMAADGTCISNIALSNISVILNVPSSIISTTGSFSVSCGTALVLKENSLTAYAHYKWFKGGIEIPGSDNRNLSVTTSGNYSVQVSNDGLCFSPFAPYVTVSVTLTATPVVSSQSNVVQCGDSIICTSGYAYYKWYFNGVEYKTTNVNYLPVEAQGLYNAAVSNDGVCYSATSAQIFLKAYARDLNINNYTSTIIYYKINTGNNVLTRTSATNFDSYYWQYTTDANPSTNTTWINIPGAVSSSYSAPTLNRSYRLVGVKGGCTSYSNSVYFILDQNVFYPIQRSGLMCASNAKLIAESGYGIYTWYNYNVFFANSLTNELDLYNYGFTGTGNFSYGISGTDAYGVTYSVKSNDIAPINVVADITPSLFTNPSAGLKCNGSTISLNIQYIGSNSSYKKYQWYDSNNNLLDTISSIYVNSPSTYTLKVLDFAGCSAQTSIVVAPPTANPDFIPVLNTVDGNNNFCIGTLKQIVISNIAQLPAGNYTYIWILNGQQFYPDPVITPAISINTFQPGTYGLQLIDNNRNICIGTPVPVTLSYYPTIAGNITSDQTLTTPQYSIPTASICSGNNATFYAPQSAGYTYQWGTLNAMSRAFTSINSATNYSYATGVATNYNTTYNSYSVKIMDLNGCQKVLPSINLAVDPAAPAAVILKNVSTAPGNLSFQPMPSSLQICTGRTYPLYAFDPSPGQPHPSDTYTWFKDGTSTLPNFYGGLQITDPGVYTLQTTLGNCTNISTPLTVTTITAPVADITSSSGTIVNGQIFICQGNSVTLTAPAVPFGQTYTYSWYKSDYAASFPGGPNTTLVGATQQLTINSGTGYYFVLVNNGTCITQSTSSVYVLTEAIPGTPYTVVGNNQYNRCGVGTFSLYAYGITPAQNQTYRWYDAATGGTFLNSNNPYTTPSLTQSTDYYVSISSVHGCESNRLKVTANVVNVATPVIAVTTQYVCGSGNVVFTAAAGGNYNWYTQATGGTSLGGGNTLTRTISNTGSEVDNYYYVESVVYSPITCTSARTSVTGISYPAPVLSIASSKGLSPCQNDFTVLTASGADTYSWSNPAGFTTAAVQVNGVPGTYYSNYTVLGTKNYSAGSCSVSKSLAINWTGLPFVNTTAASGPTTFCQGGSVTLTNYTSNIKWAKDGILISPAVTASTLNVNTSGMYTASTTSNGCTNNSIGVVVTVNTPVAITVQPQDVNSVCPGSTAVFSVSAIGTVTSYQWQSAPASGGGNFTNITGQTSASCTLTVTAAMDNFRYRCVVSGPCPAPGVNIFSNAARLKVNTPVAFTENAVDQVICYPNPAVFSVGVSGSVLSYQWQKSEHSSFDDLINDGSGIYTNFNTAFLTVNPPSPYFNAGEYQCVVTGACNVITSDVAELTIYSPFTVSQTQSSTSPFNCVGSTESFRVDASNGAVFGYQWQIKAAGASSYVNLIAGGYYTITTDPAFNFSSLDIVRDFSLNGNQYRCIIYGACTSNAVSDFTLAVTAPNSITQQPLSKTICENDILNLTVGASNGNFYTWQQSYAAGQWQNVYPQYSITPNFTMPYPLTAANSGVRFRCIVGSYCGPTVISDSVTITVNPKPATPIVSAVSTCGPDTPYITAYNASSAYNYFLYNSTGQQVATANFSIHNYYVQASGVYTWVAKDANGCASDPYTFNIYVNDIPSKPQVTNGSYCGVQGNVTLSAYTGVADDVFSWFDAAGNNVYFDANGYSSTYVTPVLSASSTYKVKVFRNSCQSDFANVTASINPNPADPVNPNNPIACAAGDITYSVSPASGMNYQWFSCLNCKPFGSTNSVLNYIDSNTPQETLYVRAVNSITGCLSNKVPVSGTLYIVQPPTVTTPVSLCYGNSVVLTATDLASSASRSFRWRTGNQNGPVVGANAAYTFSNAAASAVLYASIVDVNQGNCESASVPVQINVAAQIPAPAVTATPICGSGNSTLTATVGRNLANWYDENMNFINFTTSPNGTYASQTFYFDRFKTYYVSQSSGGCESAKTPITPPEGNCSSLLLDGVDDKFQIPNIPGTTNGYSMEMWIKASSTQSNATPGLFANRSYTTIRGGAQVVVGPLLYLKNNGTVLAFREGSSDVFQTSSFNSVFDNNCHHILLKISRGARSFQVSIYLDGSLIGGTSGITSYNVGGTLVFGNDAFSNLPFKGNINAVRLWSAATTYNIIGNRNTTPASNANGILGSWELKEGGQIVTDYSINGKNGFLGTVNTADGQDPQRSGVSCYSNDRIGNNFIDDTQEEQFDSFEVMAYPNPFAATTNLLIRGKEGKATMTLRNLNGIELLSLKEININQEILIGSELPSGVYLVQITTSDNQKIIKLVKTE